MDKRKLDIRAPLIAKLSRGTGIGSLRVILLIVLDSLMLSYAWLLADKLGTPVGSFSLIDSQNENPGFLIPILVITVGIVASSGLYGTDDRRRDFFNLIKSLSFAQVVLLFIGYLYEPEAVVSRSTFLLSWVFSIAFVL
ncbi:MAG TPA: hypothetical protein V6D27_12390, partial [Vampirovibrionales bacterium]